MKHQAAKILYDGSLFVSFGFAHLGVGNEDSFPRSDAFVGQANGLLGAACSTFLSMTFGLHTGHVSIRIELHTSTPTICEEWEEVVEASFEIRNRKPLRLVGWDDIPASFLIDKGSYRVRFCAKNFGAIEEELSHRDSKTILEMPNLDEKYLLCFWQQPWEKDQVLKVKRPKAERWHISKP